MTIRPATHSKCLTEMPHRGAGRTDMVATLVILGLVTCLLLIDLQQRRESTRRISCANNLRNIGIAMFDYHQVHGHLPIQGVGTHNENSANPDEGDAGPNGIGGTGGGNNGKSLSFLVGILPHLEQQETWETISMPSSQTVKGKLASGSVWNAMGPGTSQRAYSPWVTDMAVYRCPSDPRKSDTTGRTNYAACMGDALDFQMDSALRFDDASNRWKLDPLAQKRVEAAARGAFVFRETMRLSDITDGLSNTMLVSELVTDQGNRNTRTAPALGVGEQTSEVPAQGGIFDSPRSSDDSIDPSDPRLWIGPNKPFSPKLPTRSDEFRGMRWADARTVCTGFNSILPPNSYLQVAGNDISGPAVAPPSSHHPGGIHILLGDGSTTFITDAIESGNTRSGTVRLGMEEDLAPGSPSPYGLWGSLGTRNASD